MANPQCEDGFTKIANEIIEKLVKHRLSGREFRVLLYLIRKTYGYRKKEDKISLGQFSQALNINPENVSRLLTGLENKGLIIKSPDTYPITYKFRKDYEKWSTGVVENDNLVKNDNKRLSKTTSPGLSKTTSTKESNIKKERNILMSIAFHTLIRFWNTLSEVPKMTIRKDRKILTTSDIYKKAKERFIKLIKDFKKDIIQIRRGCYHLNEYLKKPDRTWPSSPPNLWAFLRWGYIEQFYEGIPLTPNEGKDRFLGIGKSTKRKPTEKDQIAESLMKEYPSEGCKTIILLWRDGIYNDSQRDEELNKATKKERHG